MLTMRQNNTEKFLLVSSFDEINSVYFNEEHIWILDRAIPNAILDKIESLAQFSLQIQSGESLKTFQSIEKLAAKILQFRSSKPLTLVAVGGGSCGDAVGFIASILWRGVNLIHVPTTLLAMIDSSIGGKTAVNLGPAKNQLGSFYRANTIMFSEEIFATMPTRLKREGLGEMMKSAWLESNARITEIRSLKTFENNADWMCAIQNVAAFKTQVVAKDFYDDLDIRIQLNFGHSVAHGIERLLNIPHGEAVAWGILAAAILTRRFGLSDSNFDNIFSDFQSIIRPHAGILSLDKRAFIEVLKRDKKRKDGKLRSVFVTHPGTFIIRDDISELEWFDALQAAYQKLNGKKTIYFDKVNALSVKPPLSKSEFIRLLSFSQPNHLLPDNDDTFFSSQIFQCKSENIHVGEGATGFRFAAIIAGFTGRKITFELSSSLMKRTHHELLALFDEQNIPYTFEHGKLAFPKQDGQATNALDIKLPAQKTSHIASGLALLSAHGKHIKLHWNEMASFAYFEMTLEFLKECGATLIRTDNSVEILPIKKFKQPSIDMDAGAYAFWRLFESLGNHVEIKGNKIAKRQPDFGIDTIIDMLEEDSPMHFLDINTTPDLGPVLGAYAALKKKNITFTGAAHLRNKESNRIEDFVDLLTRLNIKTEATEDGFIVYGKTSKIVSGEIDSKGDHRLVMAAALLSVQTTLTLNEPLCVSKSYWNFWGDLERAGMRVQVPKK